MHQYDKWVTLKDYYNNFCVTIVDRNKRLTLFINEV